MKLLSHVRQVEKERETAVRKATTGRKDESADEVSPETREEGDAGAVGGDGQPRGDARRAVKELDKRKTRKHKKKEEEGHADEVGRQETAGPERKKKTRSSGCQRVGYSNETMYKTKKKEEEEKKKDLCGFEKKTKTTEEGEGIKKRIQQRAVQESHVVEEDKKKFGGDAPTVPDVGERLSLLDWVETDLRLHRREIESSRRCPRA